LTQYYYLVASLPMLFFEAAPPFSSHAWLESCREQLTKDDYALLSRVSLDALGPQPGDSAAWRIFSSWETSLRNELARHRAQRLGRDPEPFLRDAPFFAGLPAVVKQALGAGTPKAVEIALDRERWSYLEELETGTQFDLDRLIVYRLKLQLLERKERFRPKPGRESFWREYDRVLENAAVWASAASSPPDTEKRND
jgi:hypothetical protein